MVERAVREVEGRTRALYLGLQDRLGTKIDARERVIAFIPEYAAYLLVPFESLTQENSYAAAAGRAWDKAVIDAVNKFITRAKKVIDS